MKLSDIYLGSLSASRERDVIWYLYNSGGATRTQIVDVLPLSFNCIETVFADLVAYSLVVYDKGSGTYKLTKDGHEYVRWRIG